LTSAEYPSAMQQSISLMPESVNNAVLRQLNITSPALNVSSLGGVHEVHYNPCMPCKHCVRPVISECKKGKLLLLSL